MIEAGRNLTVNAGKDISSTGGTFKAGADVALNAGGNVDIKAQEQTGSSGNTHLGSQVTAGGNVTIGAKGGDVTMQATNVSAGQNVASSTPRAR